jgi:hypothetical protein
MPCSEMDLGKSGINLSLSKREMLRFSADFTLPLMTKVLKVSAPPLTRFGK